MALRKFRSGVLSPALRDAASYNGLIMEGRQNKCRSIICIIIRHGAKGAHLVLSFGSSQKKEHQCDSDRSFSFPRRKENEPKEKGALQKWSRQRYALSGSFRPRTSEAIFKVVPLLAGLQKSPCSVSCKFLRMGTELHFYKGNIEIRKTDDCNLRYCILQQNLSHLLNSCPMKTSR